jgi:hypothetical protein
MQINPTSTDKDSLAPAAAIVAQLDRIAALAAQVRLEGTRRRSISI